MNCLKNTRSVLGRLVRYCKLPAAARPPPPLAPISPKAIGQPTGSGRRWYHSRRKKVATTVLIPGAAAVYYRNLETVPYTNRTHLILLPRAVERYIAELLLDDLRDELGPKDLPALHPDTLRVRRIASEIVRAIPRSLAAGGRCHGVVRSRHTNNDDSSPREVDVAEEVLQQQQLEDSGGSESPTDGRPDDGVVGSWEWEVVVVRDDKVNANCGAGGKIIVYTGLLDHLSTDAEIAGALGHEVGHAVARHFAEAATSLIWPLLLLRCLDPILPLSARTEGLILTLYCPWRRRNETEADYIGILLLGAAGYDPHVALTVQAKLWIGDGEYGDYMATHPPSSTRWKPEVMEQAMELYAQATSAVS